MSKKNDERRSAEQIMKLGIALTGHRASFHESERYEYLRGWERALYWVMHQEDPPTEFLTEDFTKPTRMLTTSTSIKSSTTSTTTKTKKTKSGERGGTGTTSTTRPPRRARNQP